DDAPSVDPRGGPEKRVDGGSKAVLARARGHVQAAVVEEQGAVWRRNVEATRDERLPVPRKAGRERSGTAQHLRQPARRLPGGVGTRTNSEGGRSTGSVAASCLRAARPPAEAPITTMSLPLTACDYVPAGYPVNLALEAQLGRRRRRAPLLGRVFLAYWTPRA